MPKTGHRLLLFSTMLSMLAAWLLAAVSYTPASAQTQVIDAQVEYTYGQEIRFEARLDADSPVTEAAILFDAEGVTHIEPGIVEVGPDNTLVYTYNLASSQPFRPFSTVNYRYRVSLENGEVFTSPFFTFFYEDNRFQWQALEEGPFQVHWYAGDVAYAQSLLDVAQAGLNKVRDVLTAPDPQKRIEIYAYASANDMQSALNNTSANWIAGHADPDLGVIVVTIPTGPDQRLLMEQRIPHELMHVMLANLSGPAYPNLPVWLNEGLASVSELYPNPDYQVLVNSAYENSRLLPMETLCSTFPRDASNVLLAYAQSASFTRHLLHTYGVNRVNQLVAAYADGRNCESGFEAAMGLSLRQAERRWRQDQFAEDTNIVALTNMLPWFMLMLAMVLAPLGASIALLAVRSPRRTRSEA